MKPSRTFYHCVFLFLILNTAVAQKPAGKPSTLESEFKSPPVSAKPKALWPWLNGNVSLSQITFELEDAKRKGMGGFDIWDIGTQVDPNHVIPTGPAFLGEESVEAIAHTIREADRIGLEIGLTFSSSWNAGGSWVKPEHGAMGLFRRDTVIQGPHSFSSVIAFPNVPAKYGQRQTIQSVDPKSGLPVFYKEVSLLAHPLGKDSLFSQPVNLVSSRDASGKVTWSVPAGTWRIVRYVCVPTGQPLAIPSSNSKGLMLDHFSADAQRYNIDYVFSKLLPVTGSLKDRSLKYLYADSYEVNSAVWTPLLPEEFQKQNGYSLEKYLPVLDGFQVESAEVSERFLTDFKKTLSNLIIENHYKLGRELCEKQGLGFYAEAGGPGKPIHNVPFEDLKALGALTVPRGEFWNKHPQLELLQIIKGISSASHIYNQKYVEAESFTSVWLWQEGPDQLKPLADRAMCEGLNRFVYHTFPHTPPESGDPGWVYNFGTLINTTNGWWPKSAAFHEYLGRCSYLLQQGNFRGDVAFYYGDEAPNFVPPKHMPASLGYGYDYDVVNSEVILDRMEVKNGRIYLPHGQYYEVLVLPQGRKMNYKVMEKLEKLIAAGATVIGPKPLASLGLNAYKENDRRVRDLADKIWGVCDSVRVKENNYGKGKIIWGKTIRETLLAKGITPDMDISQNSSIDFIHRTTGSEEIFFIRNINDQPVNDVITFRVKNLAPELWNPETGQVTPIPFYESSANGLRIPLSLGANGSCFVVFRQPGNRKPWSDLLYNGKKIGEDKNAAVLYSTSGPMTTSPGEWTWIADGKSFSDKVIVQEAVVLSGPWEVRFEHGRGAPQSVRMEKLVPLNQSVVDGVKHFSGTASYHSTFLLRKEDLSPKQRVLLELGDVKEIAEVYVNGKNVGVSWHMPFIIDVTEAVKIGENRLIVDVVNTPNNRLVGDGKLPEQYQKTKSNVIKLPNAWNKPFAEAPLINSGLIGPVRLRFAHVLSN